MEILEFFGALFVIFSFIRSQELYRKFRSLLFVLLSDFAGAPNELNFQNSSGNKLHTK